MVRDGPNVQWPLPSGDRFHSKKCLCSSRRGIHFWKYLCYRPQSFLLLVRNTLLYRLVRFYSFDPTACRWSGRWSSARSGKPLICQFVGEKPVNLADYQKEEKNCGSLRCTSPLDEAWVLSVYEEFIIDILGPNNENHRASL